MEELEEKAVEVLREAGYVIRDDRISYTTTGEDFSKIEIIPWTRIRDITYSSVTDPYSVNINMAVWDTRSGNLAITLSPGVDGKSIYKYLARKFNEALDPKNK